MTKLYLSNDSSSAWWGWQRANVDVLPRFRGGGHPRCNWLLGNKSGLDTWSVDVFAVLQPGERLTLDIDEGEEAIRHIPPIVDSPDFLGGIPVAIGGTAMERVSCEVNGAGYDVEYFARVGPMLAIRLWVTWYPDQLEMAAFEWCVDASNPAVQDVVAAIPADFRLVFGDAVVMVPGLPDDSPLMQVGDWLADAQPRLLCGVLYWWRHDKDATGYRRASDLADQLVQMRGIAKLHQQGNPCLPPGFDGPAWTKAMLPDVIRVAHNWDQSPLDPNVVSSDTGAQGAQSFSGSAAMADPSCIGPIYLAGLDVSYPMCPLERDGSQLDINAHPGLRMFEGRVNRNLPSLDNLGKDNEPTAYDCHQYRGPGYEWHFEFTGLAAARLKGTAGTQWVLEAHARLLMFVLPTSSTTDNWLPPNRGVAWWFFTGAELYRNLRNRDLAEALKARMIETYETLVVPHMGHPGGDVGDGWWSWKRDDRIGAGVRAIVWQCSVFALAMRWAGDALGHWPMTVLSQQVAEDYVSRGWFHDEAGRWHVRDVIEIGGIDTGHNDYYYPHFGVPHGVVAMLYWNRDHGVARAIWNQIKSDCVKWEQASWLAPSPWMEVQP